MLITAHYLRNNCANKLQFKHLMRYCIKNIDINFVNQITILFSILQ